MKQSVIYQHFRKEEMVFIDRVLEWKQRVEDTYVPVVTPFLNPREQFILQSLLSSDDTIHVFFDGRFHNAERKRAVLTVADSIEDEEFMIEVLSIRYPTKFATLKHSAILGSILGCGIQREQVGDIVTDGHNWQVVVSQSVSGYIRDNCRKIGSVTVTLHPVLNEALLTPTNDYKVLQTTVSSMRLDAVIATAFNISRQLSKELIEQNHVTVNWKEENKTHVTVEQFDVVSVRKHGRVILSRLNGLTKNEKYKIELQVLKNKR